jgi:hypothetical protein
MDQGATMSQQHQLPAVSYAAVFRKKVMVQRLIAATVSLSISVLIVACEKVDASKAQKATLAAQAGALKTRETIPKMSFAKGMAYADLRALATKEGWMPVIDAQCKPNVMGSNYQQLCSSDSDSALCTVCDAAPELSGCSGDGYCGMYFSKDGLTLHVVTYGMIEDLKVSGKTSRLNVDDWDVSQHQ